MTTEDILGFCLFLHTFSRVFGCDCSCLVAKSCLTLLLPHGQRTLVGNSPRGGKESDTT